MITTEYFLATFAHQTVCGYMLYEDVAVATIKGILRFLATSLL